MFKRVDANIDLPSVESEISAYWDKINAFEKISFLVISRPIYPSSENSKENFFKKTQKP